TELKKHTVNTELQFCTKAATRWQSLLSRLLGQPIDTDTFTTKEQGFFENLKPTKRFIYKPKPKSAKKQKIQIERFGRKVTSVACSADVWMLKVILPLNSQR
ncbi:hypothetical protein EAY27_02905, partial [Vibrio anguillarum]|uniref:hypothetical protein n=1 Tax=Vibrio anguillarum TaxID=55601 RepID=UPI00188B7C78